MKKILVLAPHTDDGELGCGGSITKFAQEGAEIYYAAFSTAEESVPEGFPKNVLEIEVRNATRVLGIKPENLIIYKHSVRKLNYVRQDILEELVRMRREIKPDMVFMPSPSDVHQDHYTVSMEGLRAFKGITILGYELPWNNITFKTQAFIKLNEEQVKNKVKALEEYKSQYGRNYTSEEFIRSWAKTRGVQIGADYAEAFEVIRWVID